MMQYMVYLFSVKLAVFHHYITLQSQAVVVDFCLQFEDLTYLDSYLYLYKILLLFLFIYSTHIQIHTTYI